MPANPQVTEQMVEKAARAAARANGDDYDAIPAGKEEWTQQRGQFGGLYRDVNAPYQTDYQEMAEAALTAALADHVVVPSWKLTADELPQKPGLKDYEYVDCLIFYQGEIIKRPWNCEHLCWDDEYYDDFFCDPKAPLAWMPLPAAPLPQKEG